MTLEEFIWMSKFEVDSKLELVSIKIPIKGRSDEEEGYTRVIHVESHKLCLENFYDDYIKPESEIKSFYFFNDRIAITLKDFNK